MNYLAADIGGTYSRFAFGADSEPQRPRELVVENTDFASLDAIIAHALAEFGAADSAVDRMTLAVPGPVHDDPVQLTNIAWQLSREDIRARFRVDRLLVVNDFQAAALGALLEPYERLKVLNPGTPDDGPVVVTGIGTGLGMAWLPGNDLHHLPHGTEGGHLDFAPGDAEQVRLYQRLAERFGHVSYERVLSGDGLIDVYRFMAGDNAGAQTPAEIVELAAQRGDTHARSALRLFIDVFAAYAGNLALAFNPTGGIYLCGGLAVHLADWFDPTEFTLRYAAKGRMADMVRRIPVFLVTRHHTGLAGALRLAREHLA